MISGRASRPKILTSRSGVGANAALSLPDECEPLRVRVFFPPMSAINRFLLEHNLRIATNPCVSPDFCLDWQGLSDQLRSGKLLKVYPKSRFDTKVGAWTLLESSTTGDCAWRLQGRTELLHDGIDLPDGTQAFPATFANLLWLKNLVQEHNP